MIERKFKTKRLAWMVGIAISAVSLVSMALAEPDQMLRFGSKLTTDRLVRAVVGPSVRIDDESRISLAWMEEDKEVRTVLYARTEQSGGPIGAPIKVNQPTEAPFMRQEAPALAVVGDDVFLTWALTHSKLTPDKPFSNELRLSRSTDGGKTFLPSILVNDDKQVIGHSFDSMHVAPDGVVHVAWIDGREGKKEPGTFITRSTDHGLTVAKNLKVDENTCVCCRTSLTTGPDGTLYVAWRKVLPGDLRETVIARSTDGGSTFSSAVIVGHDKWVFSGCPHRPASIGTDRLGRLYVVWYTEGIDETPAVFLAYSDDRGATFSPKKKLNVSKGTFPDHPQMVVDPEGRLVIVWEEQSPVRREVVLSVSLDRGQTFSTPLKLNEKKGQTPSLSMNSKGLAALAWMEHAMPVHRMVVQTLQLPAAKVAARQEP
ncbi:MAG TPA: sialidase family protein [Nitrospiraceae bacterium]|nr:sialidase family protein [Nitrospiraceae bacterium]